MKYLTGGISPRQAAASACRAEEWFVLAVQQLNSFCRDGEVREPEMSKAEWKISQVEKLIGLSRRDIQRACYKGRGGVAILQPKDSSWGRRNYSLEDVATLFVVKCHKERGLSLVEIKRVFERSEASEGGCAMLEDQVLLCSIGAMSWSGKLPAEGYWWLRRKAGRRCASWFARM